MDSDVAHVTGVCTIEDIPLQNEVEISTTPKESDSGDIGLPVSQQINQANINKISDKEQQISAIIDGKVVESSLKVDINGQIFHIFSPKGEKKQVITRDDKGIDQKEIKVPSADHGYQVNERKKRLGGTKKSNANVIIEEYEDGANIIKSEATEESVAEIFPQKKEKFHTQDLKTSDLKIKIKTNRKAREDLEQLKQQEKQRKKESKEDKCQTCKKLFQSKGELNKHLILKHGAKPVSPKGASSGGRSKVEERNTRFVEQVTNADKVCGVPVPPTSQDAAKKHVCNICDKFYYLESNLERHMLRDHFGESNMQDYGRVDETKSHDFGYSVLDSSEEENVIEKHEVKDYKTMHRQLYFKYNCEQCEYKSHYKHNFARHMNLNHDDYGETCNICKISFTSKSQLENHNKNMHSHTPEKKLRSYTSKNKESTETVSPPEKRRKIYTATYRCEHCNDVFPSLSDLEDHMDYHYAPAVFE